MAVKKLNYGDLIEISIPSYGYKVKAVINKVMPHGTSGSMLTLDRRIGLVSSYWEKEDMKHMKRLKSSQAPKELAEWSKKAKRYQKKK